MDLSAKDQDLITRTILSEAGPNASASEQAAIAHTILNRVGKSDYAPTVGGVIRQKGAFTPWSLPRQGQGSENHPLRWDAKSPAYQTAATIASGAARGEIDDPTGGADHYLAPEEQARQVKAGKATWPSWAQGPGQRIGQHAFYKPSAPPAGAGGPSADDGTAFLKQWYPQQAPASTGPSGAPMITVHPKGSPDADAGQAFLDQWYPQETPNERVAAGHMAAKSAPLKKPGEPQAATAGLSASDVWEWAKKNPEYAGASTAAAVGLGALMLPADAAAAAIGGVGRAAWPAIKYTAIGDYLTGGALHRAPRDIWDLFTGSAP